VKLDTFLEVLWAFQQTHKVRTRFPSRGGVFLVSPPGQLKTSLLSCFEYDYGVLGYSDMTTTNLIEARDMIASKKCNTLLFYDMQKLYERRADTASNIEGNIRSLMDEGFTSASHEKVSKNVIQMKARALVMAALTTQFYRAKLGGWESSGFARRVLFCVYTLKDPSLIERAILSETPIMLGKTISTPINLEIDQDSQPGDDEFLLRIMRRQRQDVPLNLMKKTLWVLRWRYKKQLKQKDRSLEILKEFSQCLGEEGAEIDVVA
jgi:hypothetical protein